MNWIIFSWALSVAWMPLNDQSFIQNLPAVSLVMDYANGFSATLETRVDIASHIKAWTSVETYETPDGMFPYFNPYRGDYVIGAAIYSKGIEVGVRHECDHGIESHYVFIPYYSFDQTKIYVKISGSTK